MKKPKLTRNAHFLGPRLRNLRKRNNLTMDDLSARCVKIDAEHAPSVSYLSMIERGKRYPSAEMLEVIATVFQKSADWFLSDNSDQDASIPEKSGAGGIRGMALEPGFLFSPDILQIAIPELLSQAGVTGRQFAHLLIRAHQERHQNNFPELERAAESIGKKQMPLTLGLVEELAKEVGIKVVWFDKLTRATAKKLGLSENTFVRSYFAKPGTVFLNKVLMKHPVRHKYDLAVYIGHMLLHNGDGIKTPMITDRHQPLNARSETLDLEQERTLDSQDIVLAWRDFECSFFAGALLCPKVPFRRLIERNAHEVTVGNLIDVSPSVTMRRMTAVSSYTHWHYFDALPPGRLNAVYRGNGIPLPWGNMRLVQDPCQHWAVFRMLGSEESGTSAQISLLDSGKDTRIYCCESLKTENLAGDSQVLCAGIDINPALDAQGIDSRQVAGELKEICGKAGGKAPIPESIRKELATIARVLNIDWMLRGIEKDVRLICPRSGTCPRSPKCRQVA